MEDAAQGRTVGAAGVTALYFYLLAAVSIAACLTLTTVYVLDPYMTPASPLLAWAVLLWHGWMGYRE